MRTLWTVALVALLVLGAAAGGFLLTHTVRVDRARGVAAPTSTPSATPTTPAEVLGATAAPTASATSSGSAPGAGPLAAKVAAALRPALAAAALGGSVHSLVVDAESGAALLTASANASVPPASTTKLTTATAALAVLPPGYRMTTTVRAGSRAGQIVLVGGGDPTLSAARAGTATLYPGAARMSDLAAQVKARGVTVSSIVVDDSLFSGPTVAPGWEAEDVPSDYASAITPVMVDGGLPATGGDIRSATPDLEAGRALARLLGVPAARITRGRTAPAAATLASVRSAPLLDLIEQTLTQSDNVLAELIGRQVALAEHEPASFAGAVVAVRRVLAGVGITLPATLSDASGLSQRDRLTPAALVGLLRVVLAGTHAALTPLISALPVAGWDGTLADRYRVRLSAAGAGEVRAKTGTLSGVVTLAGVVRDATGRLLVFAIMADRVPVGGATPAEAAMDVAVARLAACGCR